MLDAWFAHNHDDDNLHTAGTKVGRTFPYRRHGNRQHRGDKPMSTVRLLLPHELNSRRFESATARAFRFGPRIGPNRAPYEFYPTPPEATRALLAAERFNGSIWEPACGQGHISKVLAEAGHEVISTDLVDYGYGQSGRDSWPNANRWPRTSSPIRLRVRIG